MKRTKRIVVCLVLLLAMTLNLTGCVKGISAQSLTDGITRNQIAENLDLTEGSVRITDFSLRLFENTKSEKSSIISPLSIICALGMVVNGAEGETKTEIEQAIGMSSEELSLFLYTYVNSLPQSEKYKLSVANSIWTKDSFSVNEDFLQTNKDYYNADIYKAPFDNSTLKDINNWVNNKTDKMIPKILDRISPTSLMYLVNAIAFEAEWQEIYEKDQVRQGIFTTESGKEQQMDFMHATQGSYLENENAIGFKKYYKDSKYAFVALLPKAGMSVDQLISSLDGEKLEALLKNPKHNTTYTSIPKFEAEYSLELKEAFKNMGISLAFDMDKADLGGIGNVEGGNLYVGSAIHKAYISVAEKGTRAGAATAMDICGNAGPQEKPTYIYLDRPFVYMLIDTTTNIPFFIGTMMGN